VERVSPRIQKKNINMWMDFAQVFAIHQLEELYAQNRRNNRILLLALMEERRLTISPLKLRHHPGQSFIPLYGSILSYTTMPWQKLGTY
jgi:hypothetical protein